MDTNVILAGFGITTVVTFIAGLWYWNKRSQEIIPPIEKKVNENEMKIIELTYKFLAQEEKLNRIEKDQDLSKQELAESKKKIYDSIHQMQIDIASIKAVPKHMENLLSNFNSLQTEVHRFIVEQSKK